jgi:hypothetical protein
MDVAGMAAMERGQRAPRPVGIARGQDRMRMVRHRRPGPDLDLGRATGRREQIAIKRVIGIVEEAPRPAVAALRHVVRQAGYDEAREADHA